MLLTYEMYKDEDFKRFLDTVMDLDKDLSAIKNIIYMMKNNDNYICIVDKLSNTSIELLKQYFEENDSLYDNSINKLLDFLSSDFKLLNSISKKSINIFNYNYFYNIDLHNIDEISEKIDELDNTKFGDCYSIIHSSYEIIMNIYIKNVEFREEIKKKYISFYEELYTTLKELCYSYYEVI